jgi:molecular chaperone GrpE (heat shock protein)
MTAIYEKDTTKNEHTKVETPQYENELSKFSKYFGPSLDCLKDVFEVPSVFGKLKCLTKSLTKVTNAVQELRQQVLDRVDENNEFSLAITADDLLPLMVLIILQMDSADASAIVVELKMMQDLIPKFLSFGCHGWALVEFDMASKVLQSLCTQFDWSTTFTSS